MKQSKPNVPTSMLHCGHKPALSEANQQSTLPKASVPEPNNIRRDPIKPIAAVASKCSMLLQYVGVALLLWSEALEPRLTPSEEAAKEQRIARERQHPRRVVDSVPRSLLAGDVTLQSNDQKLSHADERVAPQARYSLYNPNHP